MSKITLRYLPKKLIKEDRNKQVNMLLKSRKMYKKGKYYTRTPVKSFKSTPSKHISKARDFQKINQFRQIRCLNLQNVRKKH